MNLADYFQSASGIGVLATSDSDGNVDMAIYARPYIIDESTIAFSMSERLSYANIQSNPKAAYMFIERGEGYVGKRLYLTRLGEEKDAQRISDIKKQHPKVSEHGVLDKHLVYFTIDRMRPLVGDKSS